MPKPQGKFEKDPSSQNGKFHIRRKKRRKKAASMFEKRGTNNAGAKVILRESATPNAG